MGQLEKEKEKEPKEEELKEEKPKAVVVDVKENRPKEEADVVVVAAANEDTEEEKAERKKQIAELHEVIDTEEADLQARWSRVPKERKCYRDEEIEGYAKRFFRLRALADEDIAESMFIARFTALDDIARKARILYHLSDEARDQLRREAIAAAGMSEGEYAVAIGAERKTYGDLQVTYMYG